MAEDKKVDFESLPTIHEKIEAVDERLGNQPDRIRHPHELLDLQGEKIFLVLSPFGKEQNIGTCFILDWEVGEVKDHRGSLVQKGVELAFGNDEKYVCYSSTNPDEGLSLRDLNIVPNNYNNHAAFLNKESAEAYAMYRKIAYAEDESIKELEGVYNHYFDVEDVKRLVKSEEASATANEEEE